MGLGPGNRPEWVQIDPFRTILGPGLGNRPEWLQIDPFQTILGPGPGNRPEWVQIDAFRTILGRIAFGCMNYCLNQDERKAVKGSYVRGSPRTLCEKHRRPVNILYRVRSDCVRHQVLAGARNTFKISPNRITSNHFRVGAWKPSKMMPNLIFSKTVQVGVRKPDEMYPSQMILDHLGTLLRDSHRTLWTHFRASFQKLPK